MARGWLPAACALAALCCTTHAIIEDVLDVIRFGKEVSEEVINSWDVLGQQFNAGGGVDLPLVKRREREVLARLANVARAIERLQLSVDRNEALSALLAKGTTHGTRFELRLHELADLLARVAASERQMQEYVRLQHEFERSTLEDFAAWCVSHDPGALGGLLERVHSLLVPPHRHLIGGGLFRMIADDMQVGYHLFYRY